MSPMSKHERGSGSMYLNGKIWYIAYWVKGHRIQKSTGSRDVEEAKRQLRIAVGEIAAGHEMTPEKSHIKGWTRACAVAGLEWLRPHDLRRSAIRNMELAGVSRGVAMAYSGHQTESVYKRYAIVSSGDMKEAVEKLERRKTLREPLRILKGGREA